MGVLSHAEEPAAQFILAFVLGFNLYELIILFIQSDWTDRVGQFIRNKTVWIKLLKCYVFISALVSLIKNQFLHTFHILLTSTLSEGIRESILV